MCPFGCTVLWTLHNEQGKSTKAKALVSLKLCFSIVTYLVYFSHKQEQYTPLLGLIKCSLLYVHFLKFLNILFI